MNTVIFPEDVANVIQSFYLANEGDDDTTDLIIAIGAELLDIPFVKMSDMVVPGSPVADDSITCPECGAELERVCVIEADDSSSGEPGWLYSCDECGSAWSIIKGGKTQRYFWG